MLVQDWTDLDADVNQTVDSLSENFDNSRNMFDRLLDFEKRLGNAEKNLEDMTVFYTDQLDMAESAMQVLIWQNKRIF